MKHTFSVFCLLFLFSAVSVNAQSNHHKKKSSKKNQHNRSSSVPDPSKTYTYELESNDPVNAPNLSFTVSPFYADIYTLNYNLGFGAQADYRLNNKINFGFFYRGSYLDRFKTTTGNSSVLHGYSADETKSASSYGFSLTYYFKNDLSVVDESVVVKSHNNGSTQTNYVMIIPAKRLQLWGFRAGYEIFNSSIHSENGNIRFQGTPVTPDTSAQIDPFESGSYSTYMHSGFVSLGLGRTRISDLHINTEKFGKKLTASVSEIYVDLLYAPTIAYSDILVSYSTGTSTAIYDAYRPYEVNANTPKNPIGFRIGYSEHVNYKFKALGSFGIELGMRPGPKAGADNLFLLMKFGLNLSVRAASKIASAEDE